MYSVASTPTFVQRQARPLSARAAFLWLSSHVTVVNIASFALLLAMSTAYIVQVNSTASKGYQIRDLQKVIHQLSAANEQTEGEIQEAQSLTNIQRAVKMIGMVPVEQAQFVDARGGSVAFAK